MNGNSIGRFGALHGFLARRTTSLEAVHNQSDVVNWGMRKSYPSDISKEAFEEIRPLLESVRK